MPPAAKRRKVIAVPKHNVIAPAVQQGIQGFGRISKSQAQVYGKNVLSKVNSTNVADIKSDPPIANNKKRELESSEGDFETRNNDRRSNANEKVAQPHSNGLLATGARLTQTQNFLQKSVGSETRGKRSDGVHCSIETPTKGARSRLETIDLASSSPSTPTSSPFTKQYDTPPSSPPSADEDNSSSNFVDNLPDELQDLINLHSSFLTALSLHYAHNGPSTPADLRHLTSGVERTWRKRRVMVHDVQKILAVQEGTSPNGERRAGILHLTDYGHGKVCIEFGDESCPSIAQRKPINEELLNATFIHNLADQWTTYKTKPPTNPSPSSFLSSLPLLPIIPLTSLSKIAPLLSKGQRRLEDLKAGAIKAQLSPLKATTATSNPASSPKGNQPTTRTTSLFSRLAAKQLHQRTLPQPPSPSLLARRSALQRLPEIAPVLASLAVSTKHHCNDDAALDERTRTKAQSTHASFTMPTLVQHLQTSLRNPIGKEEAGECVALLAEIVPEWVQVRRVGGLVGVSVRGEGVGREALRRRIEGVEEGA